MTIGELARLFNEHFGIGATLEVVPMEGWRREMYADETGLPWVMPSPNMPTLDTAIVYPGHGAVRRARCSRRGAARRGRSSWSARRGSTRSALRATMNAHGLPGVVLPAGGVRADVPEAREAAVRRLPDPRHRSRRVPAGAHRRRR